MRRLFNFSIAMATLTVLALFSVQQLYAQSAPNQAQAPTIVGGDIASAGEYPWQAALMDGGEQFCGGTLIASEWVLTAAHCVEGASSFQVMMGAHRLSKPNESSRQIIDVSQVIAHPNYDTDSLDSDIALLKLDKPATLNDRVQTIDLLQSEAAAGTTSLVLGWGAVSEYGNSSDVLRVVDLPLVSRAMCNRAYEGGITGNMICAGTAQGDKDSCYGDSGGPLVVSDGGNGWLQAGVVSWGAGCALKGSYGVYTNVPQFTSWVQGYLNGDEPAPTPEPTTTPDDETGDDTNDETGDDADDGSDEEEGDNEGGDEDSADEGDEVAFVDWIEIAAQTIGIDVDTLDSQLMEGKTIAEIAKANDVEPQAVIDALQNAEEAFIQQLLDEGAITEEEAAEWMAELPAMLDEFVNKPVVWGDEEWDEEWGEWDEELMVVDWFEIAAQTIGIDMDALVEQVDAGQSITDVATANNADPQAVIDALVAAETEFIQNLVADEVITQETADEWLATLADDVARFVNEAMDAGDVETVDWFSVAAQTIGIDVDALFEETNKGESIADVATANNTDPQAVIDALVVAETASIEQWVADEVVTQEDADEWLATLADDIAYFVNDSMNYGDTSSNDMEYVDWFDVAAKSIGIEVDALFEQIEQGQSIAEVATANDVEPQTVIDALVAAETEFIEKLVADEFITQEEADEWIAATPDDVAGFVNETFRFDEWFFGEEGEHCEEEDEEGNQDDSEEGDSDDASDSDDEDKPEDEGSEGDDADTDEADEGESDDASDEDDGDTSEDEGSEGDDADTDESDEGESDDASDEDDGDTSEDESSEGDDADTDGADEGESDDASDEDDGDTSEDEGSEGSDADTDEAAEDDDTRGEGDADMSDGDDSGEVASLSDDNPNESGDEVDDAVEWVDWFEVAAHTLGMDVDQLFEALDQGQSIAEIAVANNVESQAIVDAIASAEQAMIEQGMADGLFPQDEAEEWLDELPEVAAHFVEDAKGCTDADMIEGVDWFTVAAQTIGLDEDTFWVAVEAGQSIAEIANANGSDSQAVIDAIVQAETDLINQEVADGLISQEDADEWLAELNEFVTKFVEMGFMDEESDQDEEAEIDGASDETGINSEAGDSVLETPSPNTIQAASMTLGLQKNARAKTPATFSNNFTIYLPTVMK